MPRLPPKGILDYDRAMRHLRIARTAPASDLADLVECHWEVRWDLPEGLVHRQRNLSHASVSVAWESDGAWIYGVPGRVFERASSGRGRVFGTKFRPGASRAVFPSLVATRLTGTRSPLAATLPDHAAPHALLDESRTFADLATLADGFWQSVRSDRPAPPSVALAAAIERDRSLLRVEALAAASGRSVRELQRLFQSEVGISPKETIRRFRLQQAADRLHADPEAGCLELAMELGYFDQAHFARDFRSVVGVSPDAYRERVRAARRAAPTTEESA